MVAKKFLITVDTEGDAQWDWRPGQEITTRNAAFVPRFQTLCEKYGFVPVYLTNYEMISDPEFAAFLREKAQKGLCEVGMHLHAWYNPPEYTLPGNSAGGQPYLIEYPAEVMRQKIIQLTDLLEQKIGIRPVTHRAGRWAMNSTYFDLLMECGYLVDCSVTPGMDFSANSGYCAGSGGSDYSRALRRPYQVRHTVHDKTIWELPMTIRTSHVWQSGAQKSLRSIAGSALRSLRGRQLWLRPHGDNLAEMLSLVNRCWRSSDDYAMFMIHSSELMPGGSPYFQTEEATEHLYADMEQLFQHASKLFEGCTLYDYVHQKQ